MRLCALYTPFWHRQHAAISRCTKCHFFKPQHRTDCHSHLPVSSFVSFLNLSFQITVYLCYTAWETSRLVIVVRLRHQIPLLFFSSNFAPLHQWSRDMSSRVKIKTVSSEIVTRLFTSQIIHYVLAQCGVLSEKKYKLDNSTVCYDKAWKVSTLPLGYLRTRQLCFWFHDTCW